MAIYDKSWILFIWNEEDKLDNMVHIFQTTTAKKGKRKIGKFYRNVVCYCDVWKCKHIVLRLFFYNHLSYPVHALCLTISTSRGVLSTKKMRSLLIMFSLLPCANVFTAHTRSFVFVRVVINMAANMKPKRDSNLH